MTYLQFHNSATGQLERFEPVDPRHIGIYVCGPTVYDHIHVGNARPIVVFDMLFRLLKASYPKVTYVRNITDIDDKIIERAEEKNVSVDALTNSTTQSFLACCDQLKALRPSHQPRATDYIPDMIDIVQRLITNNRAYAVDDGHVLCSVEKDIHYGVLSGQRLDEQIAGIRVETASYKRHPSDFILWKPSKADTPGWDSPWGRGRPGWHTECVAMSSKLLGYDFDIHGGGIDLLFPHHENELCQCRGLSASYRFAKYWLHNGYVMVDGEKMSKSLGNFTYANDVIAQYGGETLRIALLMTHYRRPLDIGKKRLQEARNLYVRITQANEIAHRFQKENDSPAQPICEEILSALKHDLDTYKALQLLRKKAQNCTIHPAKYAMEFLASASFMGFHLLSNAASSDTIRDGQEEQIATLLKKRDIARKKRDFTTADRLRQKIETLYQVEVIDNKGTASTWKPK